LGLDHPTHKDNKKTEEGEKKDEEQKRTGLTGRKDEEGGKKGVIILFPGKYGGSDQIREVLVSIPKAIKTGKKRPPTSNHAPFKGKRTEKGSTFNGSYGGTRWADVVLSGANVYQKYQK